MRCEMCGNETSAPRRVRVEGSVLNLCENCSRFGVVLDGPPESASSADPLGPGAAPDLSGRLARRSRRLEERDLFQELPEMELAPDWSKRIRAAREKLNWTPEELGKRLNEKKSVLLKIESGVFRPPDVMIRKIESLLKVRLRAEPGGTT